MINRLNAAWNNSTENNMTATSTKPYLIRALYEWCNDNGYTPYLQIWVNEYTRVPRQYVQEQHITLNIGMNATQNLVIDNEWITFQARFGGVAQNIDIPVGHVKAIFAKETGEGMGFELTVWQPETDESSEAGELSSHKTDTDKPKPQKKGLKLVK